VRYAPGDTFIYRLAIQEIPVCLYCDLPPSILLKQPFRNVEQEVPILREQYLSAADDDLMVYSPWQILDHSIRIVKRQARPVWTALHVAVTAAAVAAMRYDPV